MVKFGVDMPDNPDDRLRLLAEAMKEHRTREGLTQHDAAERSGVSPSTWAHLERLAGTEALPRATPSRDTIRRIALEAEVPLLLALEYASTEPDEVDILLAGRDQLRAVIERAEAAVELVENVVRHLREMYDLSKEMLREALGNDADDIWHGDQRSEDDHSP